jgi:arylsulfatase A-like enzyme
MKQLSAFLMIALFGATFAQKQKYYPAVPFDSTMYNGKQQFLTNPNTDKTSDLNVILIVADDLGKYDLSVYGNPYIKTPNIDQLANEGILFNSGYATASVCSPSRAGFMTGRYQQRFGYHLQPHPRYPKNKFELWAFKNLINTSYLVPEDYALYPDKNEKNMGLPSSEIAISELLKYNGYRTAWIGKWHLGYDEPLLPKNFGFDYRYGCYEAYTLFADSKDKTVVNARIKEFTDKVIWKGGRKDACAIRENEVEIDEKEYITYAFFNRAKQFISTPSDKPFFVYLPITAPHTPYQAPKVIYDSLSHISEHNKRVYYSMIVALDNAIGDLITHLKEIGKYENTLIIFTSDNGAALYSETVDNKPLNGGKMTLFEGGINVPFILNCPSLISKPTKINAPVSLLDIFPTISEATGIKLPGDREYDGISLLEHNSDKLISQKRNVLYWYSDYNSAIRIGDEKLILNTLDNTNDYFDLKNDPGELNSLFENQNTEVLNQQLKLWRSKMPMIYWPRIMNYEIKINGKKYRWAV